jgi:hypothetical protein
MIYPVITLYQPWATWIMRKWKTIETRTHNRFSCLRNRTILIHAGKKTDELAAQNPYLTVGQILFNPDEMINGYILGSAYVKDFRILDPQDSKNALIDCSSVKRYGLFLDHVITFDDPIPENGEQGIWYYNLEGRHKDDKPINRDQLNLNLI